MRKSIRSLLALSAVVAITATFVVAAVEQAPPVGAAQPATLPIGPNVVVGTKTLPTTPLTSVGRQSLNSGVETHLSIAPTFESSVTTASVAAQIESAFDYAIGVFEAEYSNPITVPINVAYTGNGLGESSQTLFCDTTGYSGFRTALIDAEATPDQRTSAQDLSATDPTGGGKMCAPIPEWMALGQLPGNCFSVSTCATSSEVPTITFGVQPYTFNPSGRSVSGDYDFIGVAEHEISEVLGRVAGLDLNGFYTPDDLFRYTGPMTHSLTAFASGAYLSIDNGTTPLVDFNTNSTGDAGDYASGSPDSFDAFASTGNEYPITSGGITNVDVLGYDRIPTTLNLTPSSSTTASGSPVDITADGVDNLGLAIGDVTSGTTFTIAPDGSGSSAGASCSGSSCSASTPGLYQVTGTDTASGATGSTTFTVEGAAPFAISTSSLPNATPGQSYESPLLQATGVTPGATLKWKKAGTMPKGIKVHSTGIVSGTASLKLAADAGLNLPAPIEVIETVTTIQNGKKIKTKYTATKNLTIFIN